MPTLIDHAMTEGDPTRELEIIREVLGNPAVRAVGAWHCTNHDAPMDEAAYVAKALADLEAFSDKLDKALASSCLARWLPAVQ